MTLERCEKLFAEGKLDEAAECLKAALERDPHNPEILNNLGVLAFYGQRHFEAERYLTDALKHDPAHGEALENLAELYTAQKRDAELAPFLERALKIRPDEQAWRDKLAGLATAGAAAVAVERELGRAAVRLRRLPYPYRAGLALASNPDLLAPGAYFDLLALFNQRGETPLGEGLNLPTSFGIALVKGQGRPDIALFDDVDATPGPHFEMLSILIREGLIDTIYGIGRGNGAAGLTRAEIERLYRALDAHDLHLPLFANHGDLAGAATISANGEPRHAGGDDPQSPAYHLDLTDAHGVRAVWEYVNGGISNVIGQSGRRFASLYNDSFIPTAQNGQKRYGAVPTQSPTLEAVQKQNDLLTLQKYRDGRSLFAMRRFTGGFDAPCANHLTAQLAPEILGELVAREGFMLVHQHLGLLMDEAGKIVSNHAPYLDLSERAALRKLVAMRDDGAIWLAPAAQLVDALLLQTQLQWRAVSRGDKVAIRIEGWRKTPQSKLLPISARRLDGFCFICDAPEQTEVFLGEAALPVVANGPDENGLRSLTINTKPRKWPL